MPSRDKQLHRELVELAVGGLALRNVAAALDECRRIDHDHVEALACLAQRGQHVERVAATRLHRQAVGVGAGLQQLECRRGGIHADDLGRPGAGGGQAPGTQVAEHVEHPRAPDVLEERRAVRRLVVEPAGLLPGAHRHAEAHAALLHLDVPGRIAERGLHVGRQTLELTGTGIVLPYQCGGRHDLLHRGCDLRLQRLHARRADLADDDVAVAIEHEARQPVRFAVGEAVEWAGVQPLAQGQRDLQPVHQQRLARRIARVAAENARADERVRVDVRVAQEVLAVADHAAQGPGLESVERRARGVHLVAEHPEVPGAQPPALPRLQAQFGQGEPAGRRLGCMRHRGSLVPL